MQDTKQKIKLIHTLKSKLKLSEEDYRQRVQALHGFSMTSLDLSDDEMDQLINQLKAEAILKKVWNNYEKKRKYDNLGTRPGMASPAQLRLIEFKWAQKSFLHDPAQRAQALRHYCFRITKKNDLTFLESRDASKLIKSIESMKRREA